MSKPKQINARRRLIAAFSILVLILSLFGLFTIFDIHALSGLTRTIYNHPLAVSNSALQSNVSITKMHRSMKDVVLFTSPSRIDRSIEKVNEQEQQVYKYLDIVKERIIGNEGKRLENETRKLFDNWRPIREEVIEFVRRGEINTAAAITVGKGADHVDLLEEKMLGLTHYAKKKASDFMKETELVHSRVNLTLIVFLLLSILTSFLVALFTIKRIGSSEKGLKESEERYRSLIESQTDLICRFISDGTLIFVNQVYCHFFNKTQEELIGNKWHPLPVDDDVRHSIEKISTLSPTNPIVIIENRVFSGKGDIHWIQFANKGFFDGHGRLQEIQSVGRDITDRKLAEEALRTSESKYKQIFETNKAIKLMIDPEDGAIMEANEAACHFYGYSKKKMVTMKITDINALQPGETHLEMQKAKNEERLYFNFSHRLASGEVRDVEVYSGPVNLGGKTLLYSIIHDITDRVNAEKMIRENEARYRMLFNSGNDAIFVHQPDADGTPGHFIEVNEVACRMYGYTRDEFMGLTPYDLAFSEREPSIHKQVKSVLSSGHDVFENIHKRKNGEEIPVEISAHLFDLDDCPTILSIVRDITERKRSEEERLNLLASLQQAQKMEAIGTLAGGIAHDFNNILGIILGNAELAMDDVPKWNPASENLDEVKKACLRAKDVVRQILSFSRKTETEQKPLNMTSVVTESLKLLRASIPTSIHIHQSISNDIKYILGDPTQIHQVMINLCTNAAHAMENDGGTLDVTLKNTEIDKDTASRHPELNPGPHVHLRVSDTGDGINPEVLDRVFDPYFTTKEVGKGTGMGLAVVHGIVNNHNGCISVETETGKGTAFNIFFPAVEKKCTVASKASQKLPTGNESILFVDDEASLVNLNRQRLEKLGYKVTGESDPFEALALFRGNPDQIDLVITDMTMPHMTGDKLVKGILEIRSNTPIILCSGYSEKISKENAQSLGIRKYIEKPIEKEILARSVREVLDAGPGSAPFPMWD